MSGIGPGAGASAHIVVIGNSKGGTGKSTTAMHVVVSLLRAGYRVGTIDLDAQQGTLTRYVHHRERFAAKCEAALPRPRHEPVEPSAARDAREAAADEGERFRAALGRLEGECDFVVIDTPAGESGLSILGHSYADTLITPLNDSFIDLDVLAHVEPETYRILRPSRYAAMVWEIKKQRAQRDRGSVEWVVLRNRLTSLDAHNKRAMAAALQALSRRIGFRQIAGLSERVIYRELFLKGLTLLDLREEEVGIKLSMSHVAARRELSDLLAGIGLAERRGAAAAAADEPTRGLRMA
jgi:chromosome partitioning protein